MPVRGDRAETSGDTVAARWRPPERRDVVVTVIGMIVVALAIPGALWASYYIRVGTLGCGSRLCDYPVVDGVVVFFDRAPIVIAVLTIVISLIALVAKRRAVWVPPVGLVLMFLSTLVGIMLLSAFVTSVYPPDTGIGPGHGPTG